MQKSIQIPLMPYSALSEEAHGRLHHPIAQRAGRLLRFSSQIMQIGAAEMATQFLHVKMHVVLP
ncbi:MAG TPA: hypothetical protein VGP94_04105, partial [Tepidisphaeraceae bacterium]|nr:hypothetical protein [Tepidisphaeraceae bacterium]